ncbi:hypothetical protein [Arenimonas alkanexedens]
MPTLRLFREVQSCQDCLFSWDGYAHGFARGHTVLEKEGRIAFAADDLGYFIPRGDHIEIESQLTAIGWHRLESCPKCGSGSLFPLHYDPKTMVDIECVEVRREDLEKNGQRWTLSPYSLVRFS